MASHNDENLSKFLGPESDNLHGVSGPIYSGAVDKPNQFDKAQCKELIKKVKAYFATQERVRIANKAGANSGVMTKLFMEQSHAKKVVTDYIKTIEDIQISLGL